MASKVKNQEKSSLKILGLKVQGFRKLSAVELPFADSGLIQFKGKNKQGKTTILDTIEWLIKGNKVINKDIIQHGKEKGAGELKIGPYVISRTVTHKTQRLEVRNTETGQVLEGEVQNFLTTLINESTFNSRSFLDKTPLEQLKFCFKLFNIDFTELDKELTLLEADRLICGREVKKFGDLDESKPEKVSRIDVSKLNQQRQGIEAENEEKRSEYQEAKDQAIAEIEAFNKVQRAKSYQREVEADRLTDLHDDEKQLQDKIAELERQLKEEKDNLKQIGENIVDCLEKLNQLPLPEPEKPLVANVPLPELKSTQEIDNKIQSATAINQKAELYDQWLAKKKEKAEKESEYSSYDVKIANIRKKKIEILTSINTGVEGLEIKEDGLHYKGTYSENWSDMESIRIASELCLAQNPPLRAIFIDRFESFDKENRKEFEAWAKEHDVQIIVTIVEDEIPETITEDNVFYIEDGQIVASKIEDAA